MRVSLPIGLVLLSTLTAPVGAAPSKGSEQAVGTVYGFVSGNHAGQVHLKSPNGLLKLRYRDGSYKELDFKGSVAGWGYGAVWKVVYKNDEISKITFTGRIDPAVHQADQLVRHHYQLLGAGKFDRAYKDLGLAWRRQQSLPEFIAECKKTRLGWAAKDPPAYNLIVTSSSATEVQELIYIWELQEVYRYTLVRSGKFWEIDHVDQVTKAEFDKA